MGPRDHRIHLGQGKSPELPWQNDFIAKPLFSGPIFYPKKVPGPKCWPEVQKSDPGLKNPTPGMEKQKMRAEKPCRTQASELQTEPYSASYGQKPFWRVPVKILVYLKGQILFSNKEILFSRREILLSAMEILFSRREILDSRVPFLTEAFKFDHICSSLLGNSLWTLSDCTEATK